MGVKVTVENHINIPRHMKKIEDDSFWKFAASEWWRLYQDWVPFQTGDLYQNVIIRPKEIEHTQPYAHRVYEGNYNFDRKGKHKNASRHWDEAAEPMQKDKLIDAMQAYIDSGRLKLNG